MKYAFISRIGQGAYGFVLKARTVENGEIVAIKQINLKPDVNSQLEVYREIMALQNLEHVNIVTLKDTLYTSTSVSLVFEFVDSNLKLVIYDEKRPRNDLMVQFFFDQILQGIHHIHSNKIMHRDIKPDNILVSSTGQVKIADFGLACLFLPSDPDHTYSHQVATRWYRAPELLFGAVKYTPAVDIWAFGCVLAEFLNGEPMFEVSYPNLELIQGEERMRTLECNITIGQGSNDIEQIGCVFKVLGTPDSQSWPGWQKLPDARKVTFERSQPMQNWDQLVSASNPTLQDIVRSCLSLNPDARPQAVDCLRTDFFARPSLRPTYQVPLPERNDASDGLVFRKDLDLSALGRILNMDEV